MTDELANYYYRVLGYYPNTTGCLHCHCQRTWINSVAHYVCCKCGHRMAGAEYLCSTAGTTTTSSSDRSYVWYQAPG